MKNNYEISGDVTAIIINSPKYGRLETLISTNKLKLVQDFGYWHAIKNNSGSFYVESTTIKNGKQKNVYLHRLVTKCTNKMHVDHFNHDTLDNTDSNLRIVTRAENMQNLKGPHKDGTSGILGVTWRKDRKKWKAYMGINGKNIHLGLFSDIDEAERAVIEARSKHMTFFRNDKVVESDAV